MSEVTRDQVKDYIKQMSLIDAAALVKDLEQELGVSAAAPMVVSGGSAAEAAPAAVVEKEEFDVVLSGSGEKKIQVIKVVRELTGLGLKESKDLVDSVPQPVKEGVSKGEAEEVKKKFEEVGATVELR